MHAVFARVGDTSAGDNHHQRRLFNANARLACVCLTYEFAYLNEVCGTFLYLPVPQLELNQGKTSVGKMQYAVRLQTVAIAVVRELAAD